MTKARADDADDSAAPHGDAGDDVDVDELVRRTLENAARAPYYARVWGDRWKGVQGVADIGALPLLDKATAIDHQRELVVGEPPPGFGIASSGTTRGADRPALNVLRSDEENALLYGADDAGAGAGAGAGGGGGAAAGEGGAVDEDEDDPYPGWTLVVVGVHHGLPQRGPARDELRVPWLYHRNALSMIEACIERPQPDGRRVTAMRISAGALKTVTCWFLERGRDPRQFGVKMIGTNGSRVSAHWRELISELWDAELYDNFSLSEVPTPAVECKACHALHFAWPPLLWELVDLKSGEAREPSADGSGIGKLVVTPLAPWVQKMPLVRYDTGDVVRIDGACHTTGQPRITYLGRLRRGVVLDGTDARGSDFVLAPALVQDVLEALPETERNPHPAVTSGLVKTRELGLPRWVVERVDIAGTGGGSAQRVGPHEQSGEGGVSGVIARLRFEVRFDPRVYPAERDDVEASVRAELLRVDAALAAAVEDERCELDVKAHAPGTLDPPGDKFE